MPEANHTITPPPAPDHGIAINADAESASSHGRAIKQPE